jgi:hypothetical protein
MDSILREGTILPLPPHQPLASFTIEELRRGCQKAVIRDKNLSADRIRLQSFTRMSYPYMIEMDEPGVLERWNMDPDCMMTHPNGQCIFVFSYNHVVHAVHLSTQKLLWSLQLGSRSWKIPFEEDVHPHSFFPFSLEFRGEKEVIIVGVTTSRYAMAPSYQTSVTNPAKNVHP